MESTAASPGPVHVSVTQPVSQALDWTGRVLFKPFDAAKWFTLGFCAWLAWIGQGGGGGGGSANWNTRGRRPDFGESDTALSWIQSNLGLVISLGIVLFVLIVGLAILLTWLSSRGKFMFVDGVVHNRGAVVEPWHRFKAQADSLFGFRIVLGLIALAVFSVLIGVMVFSLFALGIHERDFGFGAFVMLSAWSAIVVAAAVVFGLIAVALNDVVVPIMWLRGCKVMPAWAEFRALLSRHTGGFALYVLMKIVLAIAIVTISCLATCLTCCIAALPYIGTVILLPLFVFRRSYSLFFLSQLGPEYAPLGPDYAAPEQPAVEPTPESPALPEEPPTP